MLTVASGKGGVGKTSVAVNLAIALRRLGVRPLVVDADFGLANVDIMLGATSKYDISYFLRGERTLQEIIQTGHEGVRFISGGSGVYDLINIHEEQLAELLAKIVIIDAPIDFIIIDTGAGINENIIRMILASSETMIVTTPEPTSVLDAYALIKTIMKRDGSHQIRILVNKCESKKEAQRVQDGFVEIVGRRLGKKIEPLGLVMYNKEVPLSIKRQIPITITDSGGATAKEIEKIARLLVDLPCENTSNNVLSRVFSRLLGDRR